ncbi:DUF58 domain-containing protein [Eudoraea chungangensis]|uniref:DUF58 domain-containing protein n=1 Tax=Eudoraea chungangensis TaxID=1481905 RepID=UPI0023EB10D2|nr:DUF58 domain-containing protein [Eudoraea chungangensis]
MPKELLTKNEEESRKGPPEVYVNLRDLIGLQYEARGFSFLPKYAVQSVLSGKHRSKLRGRGLDFDEVRKYIPGDDIRNIDWKVTARVGETHTKEFTEEKERPVFFIVDQSSSMFFGTMVYLKSVVAAQLAAVGCWRTLEVGDRVGGLVFNDNHIDYIKPRRDRKSVQQYLSLIAKKNQELRAEKKTNAIKHALNEGLRHSEEVITHDYLVVVISDLHSFNSESMKSIIRLRKRNDVIIAKVSDPGEEILFKSNLVISDGEFQTRLSQSQKIRADYAKNFSTKNEDLFTGFKKFGIPYFQVNTLDSAAKQLREILAGNRKRNGK